MFCGVQLYLGCNKQGHVDPTQSSALFVLFWPQLKPSCLPASFIAAAISMGGRTGRASRCNLRGPKTNSENFLCFAQMIGSLAHECLQSLDSTHEKLWNFCAKQMGPLYTIFYLLLSFSTFPLSQTSQKSPLLQVRLLASYV